MGCMWSMAESILVDRDWQKDKNTIGRAVKALQDFPDPINLLLFAEGTRYSTEKHAIGIDYALKNNLSLLQHHLWPRSKGFVQTIKNLDTTRMKYVPKNSYNLYISLKSFKK